MPATTIKVDSEVRDRLAAVASARHMTLGALLEKVSRRLAYEQMMREANAAMERMEREDPEAWASYLAELREWDHSTAADCLGDAVGEWPEYNTPEYLATIGTRT